MMNKFLKDKKGVTLVSLAIVVIVILILTNVLIYNVKDSLGANDLKAMQNDIQNLRDKINNYYSINGAIPAKLKYTNTDKIKTIREANVISDVVDVGDFYIIDLEELENITLNYGEDYKQITDTMTEDEASQYDDLYIINETSQNIFYVSGIKVDNDWFYTDYTSDSVDTMGINLRYFDGVKIPEGFYYVGGTKEEGIVISDNIEDLGKGTSHEVAQNLKGNQFVWVPVENEEDFNRYGGYYEGKLQNIQDYYEPAQNNNGYESEEFEYNKMKSSVLKYGGFYVGRYETGTDSETQRTSSSGLSDKAIIKQGVYVYNNIGWSNSDNMANEKGGAVQKSKEFSSENGYTSVTSTLIYGIQWDAIMQWIDPAYKKQDGTLTSFVADSTGKGNYNESENMNEWKGQVARTGSSIDYSVKNIYDLAGNVSEWTMESYKDSRRINRGSDYGHNDGKDDPASVRYNNLPSAKGDVVGFRIALYLNDEEKWSPTYDKEETYKDKNGDTAYIPKGFQVSENAGEDEINEGLVIRNAATDDRYVWIEVPKLIFTTATTETDYTNIEKDLQVYTATYRDKSYSDTWYSGCGISSEADYNSLKQKMLSSIYINGGFYISQYEIGSDTANQNETRIAVSKEGMYPYNYISCEKAQQLATSMDTGEKTSSLLFGIQWDLVLKYIESQNDKTQYQLLKDSSDLGNYSNISFGVSGGKYSGDKGKNYTEVDKFYGKPETGILFTTGITNRNSTLNIFDIAGNLFEWTLETNGSNTYPCIDRGGSYSYEGYTYSSSSRYALTVGYNNNDIGFRVAIY